VEEEEEEAAAAAAAAGEDATGFLRGERDPNDDDAPATSPVRAAEEELLEVVLPEEDDEEEVQAYEDEQFDEEGVTVELALGAEAVGVRLSVSPSKSPNKADKFEQQEQGGSHTFLTEVAAAEGVADTPEAEAAAVRIQASARGHLTRKEAKAKQAAAVKIQSSARGHMARKQVGAMRQPTVPEEAAEAVAAEAVEEATAPTDEMEAAAVRIQASARGHMARKQVGAMRQGEAPAEAVAEAEAAEAEAEAAEEATPAAEKSAEEMEAAAVRIQASARGHLTRKEAKAKQAAAVKIQSSARGHMARKQVGAMRQPTSAVPEEAAAAAAAAVEAEASEAGSGAELEHAAELEEEPLPDELPDELPEELPEPEAAEEEVAEAAAEEVADDFVADEPEAPVEDATAVDTIADEAPVEEEEEAAAAAEPEQSDPAGGEVEAEEPAEVEEVEEVEEEDEAQAREELQAGYEAHTAARLAVAAAETRLNMLPGVVSLPLWVNKRKDRGEKTSRGEAQPVSCVTDGPLPFCCCFCIPPDLALVCWVLCWKRSRSHGRRLPKRTKTILSWPHARVFSSLVFATVAHSALISLAVPSGVARVVISLRRGAMRLLFRWRRRWARRTRRARRPPL